MSHSRLSRRDLLSATSLFAASGLLSSHLGTALGADSTGAPRRLLVVLVSGGWDVTFALDPKLGVPDIDGPAVDQNPDNPEDVEAVQTFGAFQVGVNPFRRPNVAALFEAHADKLCVINGMWVGNLAHFDARGRVITGSIDRSAPDLATIFGIHQSDAPIASIDLSGVGRVGPYADRTAIFGQEGQLSSLVDPARRMPAPPTAPQGYRGTSLDAGDRAALQAFLHERNAVDPLITAPRGDRLIPGRAESMSRAERLAQIELPTGDVTNLRGQLLAAVDLLSRNITSAVTITCSPTFDTHTDQLSQHPRWNNLCSDLRVLIDLLIDNGMMSDTTVMVVSDFGRMPQRNYYGGTDHFPHTSAMLFGAGIAGGRLIGATDDRLRSMPLSLETGELDATGPYLRPDNLIAGMLEMLDVDPEAWLPGSVPLRAFRA